MKSNYVSKYCQTLIKCCVLCTTKLLNLVVPWNLKHTRKQKVFCEAVRPRTRLTDQTETVLYGVKSLQATVKLHITVHIAFTPLVCMCVLPSDFFGTSEGSLSPVQVRDGFSLWYMVLFFDVSKTARISYWRETEARCEKKRSHWTSRLLNGQYSHLVVFWCINDWEVNISITILIKHIVSSHTCLKQTHTHTHAHTRTHKENIFNFLEIE